MAGGGPPRAAGTPRAAPPRLSPFWGPVPTTGAGCGAPPPAPPAPPPSGGPRLPPRPRAPGRKRDVRLEKGGHDRRDLRVDHTVTARLRGVLAVVVGENDLREDRRRMRHSARSERRVRRGEIERADPVDAEADRRDGVERR